MYSKYTLFYESPKTGDITHMRKQCVPGLSPGGRGQGTKLEINMLARGLYRSNFAEFVCNNQKFGTMIITKSFQLKLIL